MHEGKLYGCGLIIDWMRPGMWVFSCYSKCSYIHTSPLLICIFNVSHVFVSVSPCFCTCLPLCCLSVPVFLGSALSAVIPSWTNPDLVCVSLRRPVCGYVHTSAQAPIMCLSYLAQCIQGSLRTPLCVRKCKCACVCGRLHHSSCLLTSIRTPMTELHSKPIQAATFRTPPKQTLISNNASWDCSQNYAVKWGGLRNQQRNHGWADRLFQVLHPLM